MKKILIFIILAAAPGLAQQRILVSPNNEVIPLHNGESAFTVARKETFRGSSHNECTNQFTFGLRHRTTERSDTAGFRVVVSPFSSGL